MKKTVLIILSLYPASWLFGQILNQETYRQKVLDYNQDVKKAAAFVEAATQSTKSVKTQQLPRVDFNGNYSYQFFPQDFLATTLEPHTLSTDLTLAQNVFAGNAISSQINAAKIQESIANLGQSLTRENIVYAADVNYWNTSANRELYAVSQQFYTLIDRTYLLVKQRYIDGMISKTDLLMIETRKREAELQIANSEKVYRIALQNLNILAGMDPQNSTPLDSIQHLIPDPMLKSLEEALVTRPDYQIALKNVELAQEQTRAVKSQFLPTFVVGVQETFGTLLINTDNSTRWNTIAFAKLNVPIFGWNNRKYTVSQAKINIETNDLERAKIQDQVSRELHNAQLNLQQTQAQIKISNEALTIASENLQLNTISYNEGRLPILDVMSAQISWLQAYTNVIAAYLQNKIAVADLNKALGANSN